MGCTGMSSHLLLIFILFGFVYTQVPNYGKCRQVEVVNDFDADKYLGLWYEYARYPILFEFLGKCVTANYTANLDGSIGVYNRQINSIFQFEHAISGTAKYNGPRNEAKLTVTFPGFLGNDFKGNYWILDTDYQNYSIVWSCTDVGYINFISAWILTRDRLPTEETTKQAFEVVDKNNISRSHYSNTDQMNCPTTE